MEMNVDLPFPSPNLQHHSIYARLRIEYPASSSYFVATIPSIPSHVRTMFPFMAQLLDDPPKPNPEYSSMSSPADSKGDSPTAESTLPPASPCMQPLLPDSHASSFHSSMIPHAQVMTDEQLETLRRQISVYATICKQLVEMHKSMMVQQSSMPGLWFGQTIPLDSSLHSFGHKLTSRQRWTPSQTQLQILEKLFDRERGTPSKQRIKEITVELSLHGQISETNVYNWFQNRRARMKRKQQLGSPNNVESEIEIECNSPEEKKIKLENHSNDGYVESRQRSGLHWPANVDQQHHGIPENCNFEDLNQPSHLVPVIHSAESQEWVMPFSGNENKPGIVESAMPHKLQGNNAILNAV